MNKINSIITKSTKEIIKDINDYPLLSDRQNRIDLSKDIIDVLSTQLETNIASGIRKVPDIPDDIVVKDDDMISLYSDKFSKSDYYNLLKLNIKVCPVCGCSIPTTIDHYFPKSEHPLFSVTPVNLVPMCFDCNKNKDTKDPNEKAFPVFNAYYDDIDISNYLIMDFSFLDDGTFVPRFRLEITGADNAEEIMIEENFKLFCLKNKYENEAALTFELKKEIFKNIYLNSGAEALRNFIAQNDPSNRKYPFITAFYQSLLKNFDLLTGYLGGI